MPGTRCPDFGAHKRQHELRDMTLRTCHIVSGDLWAGAESMVYQLICGLHGCQDTDVFAIVLNEGRLAEKLACAGVSVIVLDERKRSFIEIAKLAAREVRQRKPQIIHSHRYKENFLAYLVSLLLRPKPKLLSTLHGLPEFNVGAVNLGNLLRVTANQRLLRHGFHKTVAVSKDIKQVLVDVGAARAEKIEVIKNGIDIPREWKYGHGGVNLVIGSAGRFFPVKDYPLMVEIASEVCGKADGVTFRLAGEGPALESIRASINKHGLEDKFQLVGFVEDVSHFYTGLDVYMNTSKHEGIPMSVLEAMARGLPTIAPNVGGLGEIVTHGVDGFLIDERNPAHFAEKCVELSKNAPLLENMSRAARKKVVEQFSVDRMVCDYRALYSQTVADS